LSFRVKKLLAAGDLHSNALHSRTVAPIGFALSCWVGLDVLSDALTFGCDVSGRAVVADKAQRLDDFRGFSVSHGLLSVVKK
jgi:hypothetical protein